MKDFLSELMEQTGLQYKSFIKKGNDLSNALQTSVIVPIFIKIINYV